VIRAERFDAHLADRGLWAVLALRPIPLVPFTALNYLAGLTALRLRDFVIGTVIGMIPTTTASSTRAAAGAGQRASQARRTVRRAEVSRRMPGSCSWCWTWSIPAFHTPSLYVG